MGYGIERDTRLRWIGLDAGDLYQERPREAPAPLRTAGGGRRVILKRQRPPLAEGLVGDFERPRRQHG